MVLGFIITAGSYGDKNPPGDLGNNYLGVSERLTRISVSFLVEENTGFFPTDSMIPAAGLPHLGMSIGRVLFKCQN